jgi:hypothetical protein
VPATTVASDEHLEEIIEARIEILGLGNLFPIGRQVITDYPKRIDILAVDGQGDLHARSSITLGAVGASLVTDLQRRRRNRRRPGLARVYGDVHGQS